MTCDRCGEAVKAAWVVYTKNGGLLYFCGHHFTKNLSHIRDRGYRYTSTQEEELSRKQRIFQ